jgi:hypothetical protein
MSYFVIIKNLTPRVVIGCTILVAGSIIMLLPPRHAIAQQLPPEPLFLTDATTVDNSAAYQAATDAMPGGTRDTLPKWKAANGFSNDGTATQGEATAIYFNNGDLKFGRDMHCRVTNTSTKATACYVTNFGTVGTDDAMAALAAATMYEASHQTCTTDNCAPVATVAMEYDPAGGAQSVQFWAYDKTGAYLPRPILDSFDASHMVNGVPKPMPDICMACHQGSTFQNGPKVTGAVFLPFDLDSFLDATGAAFPMSSTVTKMVQQQFNLLNNMVLSTLGTNSPTAIPQLVQLWYPGAVGPGGLSPDALFTFNQGAAQLPGTPFAGHEPLYDQVVKVACRSCHTAMPQQYLQFTSYSQMVDVVRTINSEACATHLMPHAKVPWLNFWQNGLSSILASQLNLSTCPP